MLADSVTGLAVDLRVRRLLIHQAAGFAESGMAVSVSYDPSPSTPLGFTARVAPAWGSDAMSGAAALWGRDTMGGMGIAGGPLLDVQVLEEGQLRLQLGVEAERRVSPIFGFLDNAGGGADDRGLGQASVEW